MGSDCRFNAATELATRSLTTTEVNSLITMAENPTDANQREAACTALGCLKTTSAVPALTRRLTDPDIWVRAKAAKALGQVNAASVASAVPDMLDAFVTNVAPTYPFEVGFNWNDPLQIANGYLAETLFEQSGSLHHQCRQEPALSGGPGRDQTAGRHVAGQA